jgi:SWI/SNF-related matrix-associated actin-dependent regulator 1 of chromatin subfamily A
VHPGIKAVYVTSRIYDKEQFKYADAIFCNYDIMGEWTSFGASQDKFELVVLDEAHLLSNTKSKRSVGCLGAAMSGERVVAATATPLWNTPDGLHNILSYLNPKGWGTWPEFTIRYCNAEPGTFGWSLGEPSNVDEFQDRLSEVMLRRTWGDILGELPKIGRSIEIVDLTRKDRLELDHHLYSLLSSVENKIPQVGIDAHLRDVLGCLKLKTAADTARRFLEAHEDVVIWTWHKNLANGAKERLSRQGFSAYVTTGDDSDSVQTETLDAWRRDPNPSALVLTIGVGQVGIDLSKARHCIFAELDYTPVVISQAEMRTFSKDRPMTVTYILADHELDHRLLKTILRKCKEAYELGTPTTETDLDVLRAAFSMEKPDLKAVVDGL